MLPDAPHSNVQDELSAATVAHAARPTRATRRRQEAAVRSIMVRKGLLPVGAAVVFKGGEWFVDRSKEKSDGDA